MAVGWGAAQTSDQLTLISAQQDIRQGAAPLVITLEPNQVAQLQFECDFQDAPANNAHWRVLTSPDGGTTWDTDPIDSGTILNTPDPGRQTTLVGGYHSVKIQMWQSGSTDTTNVGRVRYRVGTLS